MNQTGKRSFGKAQGWSTDGLFSPDPIAADCNVLNDAAFGNQLYRREDVECEMLVGGHLRQLRVHIPSLQYTQLFDGYQLAAQLNEAGIMNFSLAAVIDFLINNGMIPYPVEECL